MNKCLWLFCFWLLLPKLTMEAQGNFGVKSAISLSFAKSEQLLFDDPFDYLLYEVIFEEEDVSPSFGIFGFIKEDNLFLQGELVYRNITSNFSYIIWENNPPVFSTEAKRSHFLTVPVIGGVQIQRYRFGVGPVFSFIVSENEIFEEFQHFEERREWLEAGFAFNVGAVIYRLQLDVRYELHFNRIADYFVYNQLQSGFGQSPGYLSISIGYMIL